MKLGKQKNKLVSLVRKLSPRKSRQTVLDETVLSSVASSDEDRSELNEESESNVLSEVVSERSRSDIRRKELERELRLLSLEEEVAELRSLKPKSLPTRNKKTVPKSETTQMLTPVERQFRVAVPTGTNNLGTFNGKTDSETFLFRFQNCVDYFCWNEKDKLFQLKNSLIEDAGFVVTEVGPSATVEEIIQLLKNCDSEMNTRWNVSELK